MAKRKSSVKASASCVVFISYSHDSDEHRERVLSLSERLRRDGFDVRLDRYVNGTPAETWPRWMQNQLDAAQFVLVVCTRTYYRRFRGQENPGIGKGVDWEGTLITQELYDDRSRNPKFIPILFEPQHEPFIPEPLRGSTFYTLTDEQHYQALLDALKGAARLEASEVGERKAKTRRTGKPLTFDKPAGPEVATGGGGHSTGRSGVRSALLHNLPQRLGDRCKGREQTLKQLSHALRDSSGRAVGIIAAQAIHGLGGVGKTRLATEYAWRHITSYSHILFLSAASEQSLDTGLASLCGVLDLSEAEAANQEVQVQAVCGWLSQHGGWLLILDNIDDHDAARAVQKLLSQITPRGVSRSASDHTASDSGPINNTGHVLITARWTVFGPGVQTLELDVLDAAAAVDLLYADSGERRKKTATDKQDVRDLAHRLDYLAVALEQAAAYIYRHRISFADYSAEWDRYFAVVSAWHDELQVKYPNSVATTWITTLNKLSDDARALLNVLSWLSSDTLPASVFKAHKSTLLDLAEFSIIKWDALRDRVQVHRLVQDITRSRIRSGGHVEPLTIALNAIQAALPAEPPDDVRSWPVWDVLRPHVRRLIDWSKDHGNPAPTSVLLNDLGLLLLAKALYAEAEPLLRRALAIDEQSFGAEHSTTVKVSRNYQALLKKML